MTSLSDLHAALALLRRWAEGDPMRLWNPRDESDGSVCDYCAGESAHAASCVWIETRAFLEVFTWLQYRIDRENGSWQ